MTWVTLLVLGQLELGVELGARQVCRATIYGQPGDRLAGGHVPPDAWHVAHRSLRKKTFVRVCRTGKNKGLCTMAPVLDRGPFMRIDKATGRRRNAVRDLEKQWKTGQPLPAGKWTACIDLVPQVAAAIGLPPDGSWTVEVRPIRLRTRWHRSRPSERNI